MATRKKKVQDQEHPATTEGIETPENTETTEDIESTADTPAEDSPVVAADTIAEPERPVDEGTPLPWLTVESVLWAAIIIGAAVLRLWDLAHYPLSSAEASQSLVAWNIYQGDVPAAETYSPLIVSLNLLTFFVIGASDATARLAPALLGLGLVIVPLTLRRQLGVSVALMAAALLAFSPTALFLSRTVNGEIGTALGALMLLAGFFNWVNSQDKAWLWLAAGGLAVLLTSGPLAYSVLVIVIITVIVNARLVTEMVRQGLTITDPDEAIDWTFLRTPAIVFAVLLVLLGTAFTLNLSGLGVTTRLVADWIGRFQFQTSAEAGFNIVFLLTIYEIVLVIAGLTGLAYVILQRNPLEWSMGIWFVAMLIIDVVMGGRPFGSAMVAVVPLAFLAAVAFTELWQNSINRLAWSNEGLLVTIGLTMAIFSYIGLTGWLERFCAAGDTLCELSWIQPIAALTLFIVVAISFAVATNPGVAWRGASLTGVIMGAILMLSIGWRLNFGPLMQLGYQPLAGIPAATGLSSLTDTIARQSAIRVGDSTALDILVVGNLSPAVQWQLREYRNLSFTSNVVDDVTTSAILTPVTADFDLGTGYLGQDFQLDAYWSPVGLPPKQFVRWLLYRQGDTMPQGNRTILWLRVGADDT